jgi:hypothetical protein
LITMVQVIGSVEDDKCFNNLNFIESKLQNWLTITIHCKDVCSTILYIGGISICKGHCYMEGYKGPIWFWFLVMFWCMKKMTFSFMLLCFHPLWLLIPHKFYGSWGQTLNLNIYICLFDCNLLTRMLCFYL